MAAAAPAPQKNRGSLEFKITSAASTDHDYVVLKAPDLAPFQSVLDYCAAHFEAKDHKTCVIQTKGTYALLCCCCCCCCCCGGGGGGGGGGGATALLLLRRVYRCAGVLVCRCWCRCWCF